MVKNPHIVEKFERESLSNESLALAQKYTILEEMYALAKSMGRLETNDSFDDLEIDIKIARLLHCNVEKPYFTDASSQIDSETNRRDSLP
jgi:hypothetical protein